MATHVYELTLSYNNSGQFSQNILHYQFDDAGFASTYLAANALISAWNTGQRINLQTVLPAGTKILSIKSRRVTGGGGFEAIELGISTWVGARTGNASVSAVSPVIIHYPATTNNRNRGKTYWPGVADADLIDGKYSTAYQTAVATACGLVFDDLVLTGGGAPTAAFGIYNQKTGIFTVASIHRLSPVVGTLRRRQRPA
jgi:hypothetical protein